MSSNFGSVPKLLSFVDARKTFLLKALLSSRSGDDCCVIRPLVGGLCIYIYPHPHSYGHMSQCKMDIAKIYIFAMLGVLPGSVVIGIHDQKFIADVIEHFGATNTVSLTRNCNDFTGINILIANSYMCYSNEADIVEIVQHIQWLLEQDQLDFINFMGSDHDGLLLKLDNSTNLFHSSVAIILSEYPSVQLSLRLDTRLFYYNARGNETFKLFEHYTIRGGPPITRQIGTWTTNQGLIIPISSIWDRRADLMAVNLKSTTMPFSIMTIPQYDSRGSLTSITGLLQDMLHRLESQLNFTSDTVFSKDGKWGTYKKETHSGNGIVGTLFRGEADMIVAHLTQTLERAEAISFTIPILTDSSTLISLQENGQSTQFWVYTNIFTTETWVALAGLIMATCLGFFAINFFGANYFHKSNDSEKFGIDNSFALSVLFLWQLSYNVVIERMSAKVIYFVIGIAMYLIFTDYTSDLTSRMTSGLPSISISSFNDVIKVNYKVIVEDSTSNHDFLKSSDHNSAMHKVYWNQMDGIPEAFDTPMVALDRVLTEEKTLFFASPIYVYNDERFVALKLSDSISGTIAWAFQKDSEFVDIFNHYLHKMQEYGIMDKMSKDWNDKATTYVGTADSVSLGFENTLFPFLLLFGGMLSAMGLVLIEALFRAKCNRLFKIT
jgi:ABC-type amino acid transport substrate-binding protein